MAPTTTWSQKKKQSVIPVDKVEVDGNNSLSLTVIITNIYIYRVTISLVPKENQAPTKKAAKKRGRKKKEPVVENDELINDDDEAPKTTSKRKTVLSALKTTAKCKAVVSAPKTTAKRNWKETASNDDMIQADNKGSDEDINIQEPANASINKLLEISDDDNDLSEGKF